MIDRLDNGKHWFDEVYGEGKADGLIEMQEGLAQDLARFGIEFNFGEIYSRPGLTLAQRELAVTRRPHDARRRGCAAAGSHPRRDQRGVHARPRSSRS